MCLSVKANDLQRMHADERCCLHSLAQVHRLETSSLCPRPADLLAIKAVLDKSSSTAEELRQVGHMILNGLLQACHFTSEVQKQCLDAICRAKKIHIV